LEADHRLDWGEQDCWGPSEDQTSEFRRNEGDAVTHLGKDPLSRCLVIDGIQPISHVIRSVVSIWIQPAK
jgi:hypothetical protein